MIEKSLMKRDLPLECRLERGRAGIQTLQQEEPQQLGATCTVQLAACRARSSEPKVVQQMQSLSQRVCRMSVAHGYGPRCVWTRVGSTAGNEQSPIVAAQKGARPAHGHGSYDAHYGFEAHLIARGSAEQCGQVGYTKLLEGIIAREN